MREGINIFLAGFVPTENLRFRDEALTFKVAETADEREGAVDTKFLRFAYPAMTKSQGSFTLHIEPGEFTDTEIIVLLGENGTGKTTFIRLIAGLIKPDDDEADDLPSSTCRTSRRRSPQVRLHRAQPAAQEDPGLLSAPAVYLDVIKPLNIEALMDNDVINLSGGELQRVALTLCMGAPADLYLIDEPSAYLDSEQRIWASKVIKRFIIHSRKAFIVEHDFIWRPTSPTASWCTPARPRWTPPRTRPWVAHAGMNQFLKHLEITFGRDPTNYRPRINKYASVKDAEQKAAGEYYYCGD